MPDALAGLAASAALAVSDIPFNGPISEVRVARIDGKFVINPTFDQLEQADMDIMVAATYENIMMVEGEMNEVSEAELLEAMKVAHEAIKVHCKAQMELTEKLVLLLNANIVTKKTTKNSVKPFMMPAMINHMLSQLPATETNMNARMLSMQSATNSKHSSRKKNWKKKVL